MSSDPGTIRSIVPADGWVAIFAVPAPPYVTIIPVIAWAHTKRDGADHIDAYLAGPATEAVAIHQYPLRGVFDSYMHLPTATSQVFVSGGMTAFELRLQLVAQQGQLLATQEFVEEEQDAESRQ